MNKWLIAGLISLVIIVLGGLVFFNNNQASAPNSQTIPEATKSETGASKPEIIYNNDGFSPNSLTVKLNEQVTITNNSSKTLQFDSDPHPQHTDNPELNVEIVQPNESKSFSVSKTGDFGIHNHLNSSERMTLTVK